MRDDMSKVVTERPRQGHGNKSKKILVSIVHLKLRRPIDLSSR